jgi:hypothetical protein
MFSLSLDKDIIHLLVVGVKSFFEKFFLHIFSIKMAGGEFTEVNSPPREERKKKRGLFN